jgi:hypothetical protein
MPFSWRRQESSSTPPADDAFNLARFHASTRVPDSDEVHLIWQVYCYGPNAIAATQGLLNRLRHGIPGQLEPSSWVNQVFQVITSENRTYCWDSGSVTEELLLTDRIPNPGEFAVLWEGYVRAPSIRDAARKSGEQLLDPSLPAQFVVTDSAGRTVTMTIEA